MKDAAGAFRVNLLPQGPPLTDADVRCATICSTNLYYLNGTSGGYRELDRLVADRVRLRVKPTESFAQTVVERLDNPGPDQRAEASCLQTSSRPRRGSGPSGPVRTASSSTSPARALSPTPSSKA